MARRAPLVDYDSSDDDEPPAKRVAAEEDLQRVRAVPHVAGNWATLVFIVVGEEAKEAVDDMLDAHPAKDAMQRIPAHEWHVSLSRTVYLKLSHIQPFVESLSRALASFHRFSMWPTGTSVLRNDSGATAFLAVDVASPSNGLLKLLAAVDNVVASFGFARYYAPPQLHFSVAWAPASTAPAPAPADAEADLRAVVLPVASVRVRAGNRHFDIALPP